jgi:hypothetical protein
VRSARDTWALVVGIDAYDNFKHLTGAANDSVEFVSWLRQLGVPAEKIMFHAAPCADAKAGVEAAGLQVGLCTDAEIWGSFRRLMEAEGERLFVFLAGHGLFEPGGVRVFLTQEAGEKELSNLGVEWYARLLRGLPFRRQFLILDGCQNIPYTPERRAAFGEGTHSVVTPDAPRADVVQVLCCAAAQGEPAFEAEGRGLFSRSLLDALRDEDPACVDIDDSTGAIQLDVIRAVEAIAKPTTIAEASERYHQQQTPSVRILHGETSRSVPISERDPPNPVKLRVEVCPDRALPHVKRVRLFADENEWNRVLPVPPGRLRSLAYEGTLPRDLNLTAQCVVDHDDWLHPLPESVCTDQDRVVTFDLELPKGRPPRRAGVQLTDDQGRVLPLRFAKKRLASPDEFSSLHIERDAFTFELPDTDADEMRSAGHSEAERFDLATPPSVEAIFRSFSRLRSSTAVELPITPTRARSLAGVLAAGAMVEVGDASATLLELAEEPLIPVDGGPTAVRLELPWGSWSKRVLVEPGTTAVVTLPRSIGVPPLRARWLWDPTVGEPRPGSVITRVDLNRARLVDARGDVVGALAKEDGLVTPNTRTWRGRLYVAPGSVPAQQRWQRYVDTGGLRFPLSAIGAVGLALGKAPRAEPLSLTDSPIWDRLVSAGHLDGLTAPEARELARGKWKNLLMGLAGAYACYASSELDFLSETLGNLHRLDPGVPDLVLLEGAHDMRRERRSARLAARLDDAGVPLFRWGIAIGISAGRHYGADGLVERLGAIERRLVPSSSWTLWRPADVPG